ncbi:hypothetical protein BH23PLA1_BH23PLA1_18570 [soil metagenome]
MTCCSALRDGVVLLQGKPRDRVAAGATGFHPHLLAFIINPNTDFQINYSRFFAGPFVERTGVDRDGEFFYMQFAFRF